MPAPLSRSRPSDILTRALPKPSSGRRRGQGSAPCADPLLEEPFKLVFDVAGGLTPIATPENVGDARRDDLRCRGAGILNRPHGFAGRRENPDPSGQELELV